MKLLSRKTIERTLLYIRTLEGLLKAHKERVSSRELAEILGATDVQIRKEISKFGRVGKPRVGYDTAQLKKVLEAYLLRGRTVGIVLFGVGNLGKAILRYPGFQRGQLKVVAAFDRSAAVIGKQINGVPVYAVEKAFSVIRRRTDIDVGVIAVPEEATQSVADLMVRCGLKGIVNFAPRSISVPSKVRVRDIDLRIEFLSLYCDTKFFSKACNGT